MTTYRQQIEMAKELAKKQDKIDAAPKSNVYDDLSACMIVRKTRIDLLTEVNLIG